VTHVRRCAILTGFDPSQFKGGIESYNRQLVDLIEERGYIVDVFHSGNLPRAPSPGEERRSLARAMRNISARLSGRKDRREALDPKVLADQSHVLRMVFPVGNAFRSADNRYDLSISHAFFGFGYFPARIPSYTILHSTHAQYGEANREVFPRQWYEEVHSLIGLGAERLSTVGRQTITVSDAVAEEAREIYGARSVTSVPTGVDRSIFYRRGHRQGLRAKYGIPHDAFVGVFVARWGEDKAIDVLEQVIAATQEVFWLLVLGTGAACPLAPSERLIIREGLDADGVAEMLSLGDFLFHPARYEGFGLVFVEALACGLPVIAPPVGIMREIGESEPFRSLVLPDYAEEGSAGVIAGAVETIAGLKQSSEGALSISAAAMALVERRFNLKVWKRSMAKALRLD